MRLSLRALAASFSLLALSACGTATYTAPAYSGDAATSTQAGVVSSERARVDATDTDRQLIRTARLGVEVNGDDRIAPTLAQAASITESLGGYVSQEGPNDMVLRIPDAHLDDALDRLGALGRVERREVRVQDVTAAYTDLDIRLTNARTLQSRLRDLLADAETVQDILAVETELARVTADVERLEGQMRLLQNQVALSTVQLRVTDRVTPGPVGWLFVGAYEAVKWLFVWD